MEIINGRDLAKQILTDLKQKIAASDIKPGLAVILVGDDPASDLYVRIKERTCAEVGIRFEKQLFSADADEREIVAAIKKFNQRRDIQAILIQLPLPAGLDTNRIIAALDPKKDADGFHPANIALLPTGQPPVEPVLAKAVWALIQNGAQKKYVVTDNLSALIIGNSDVFLDTLAAYLRKRGLMVSTSQIVVGATRRVAPTVRDFDVVIVTAGRANFLDGENFKDGAIVIDVGINRDADNKLTGDVNWSSVQDKNIYITSVPGGVGPMTVAMLLDNCYQLARKQVMKIIVRNLAETQKLAQKITRRLKGGEILCLSGELGAGKTAFTKALAKALGVKTTVRSPSFNLLKVYHLPQAKNKPRLLVHLDCYRLHSPKEAVDIGLLDYLNNPAAITVIEWPEKIDSLLPKNRTKLVRFETLSENGRRITLLF